MLPSQTTDSPCCGQVSRSGATKRVRKGVADAFCETRIFLPSKKSLEAEKNLTEQVLEKRKWCAWREDVEKDV
jgi:hypothetical protein